jgi:L-lactate permease
MLEEEGEEEEWTEEEKGEKCNNILKFVPFIVLRNAIIMYFYLRLNAVWCKRNKKGITCTIKICSTEIIKQRIVNPSLENTFQLHLNLWSHLALEVLLILLKLSL